jgi:hypothetical protein
MRHHIPDDEDRDVPRNVSFIHLMRLIAREDFIELVADAE